MKMSHLQSTVVDDVLPFLEEKYVKVAPLKTTWGKIHNYLGMILDFILNGKVSVTMPNHIQNILGAI